MDGVEMKTLGSTTPDPHQNSNNSIMKDEGEVDEVFSIVKTEITTQDNDVSVPHQKSTEEGARRSSRKRKPLVNTLVIGTDDEIPSVVLQPPVSKKGRKRSSHPAKRLPSSLPLNVSELEKSLGKFLVVSLPRCDDSAATPRVCSKKSRRPTRTPEERARRKMMTKSEKAYELKKKQVEELKKLGFPTKELKPFKPRKKRKTLEEIRATQLARCKRIKERLDKLRLPALENKPSILKHWKQRTSEEHARLSTMSSARRRWERMKIKIEELKRKGLPAPELKPFRHRRKKNEFTREEWAKTKKNQSRQNLTPEERERVRKYHRDWHRLHPHSKSRIRSQPRVESVTDRELLKAKVRERMKRYRDKMRKSKGKVSKSEKLDNISPAEETTDEVSTTPLVSSDFLIVENPHSVPLQLPQRFKNRHRTYTEPFVSRRIYSANARYHLRVKLLKEKARKDSLNDSSPLSIPTLYGTPFSELLESEQGIILDILQLLGSQLNIGGEWTQKIAAIKAEKVAEAQKNAQKLLTTKAAVPCPVCDSCFPGLPGVKAHLNSHFKGEAGKWINCKFCQALFPNASQMFIHYRRVHLKVKEFFCNVCGRGFSEKNQLERHELSHWSKEKLLEEGKGVVCPTCGKVISNHLITDHETKVHGKGNQFLCSICGLNRNSLGKLNEHIVSHMNAVERAEFEENRRKEKAVSRLRLAPPLPKERRKKPNQRKMKRMEEMQQLEAEQVGKELGKVVEEPIPAILSPTQNELVSGVVEEEEQEAASTLEDCNLSNFDEEEAGGVEKETVNSEVAEIEPKLEPGPILPHELSTVVEDGIGAIIKIIPLEEFEGGEELEDVVKTEVEWEDHPDHDDELHDNNSEPEDSPPASPVPILIPVEEPREKRRSIRKRAKPKRIESESDASEEENDDDDDFYCPSDPDFDPGDLPDEDFSLKRRLRGSSTAKLSSSSKTTSPLPLPPGEKRKRGRPRIHPLRLLPPGEKRERGRPRIYPKLDPVQMLRAKNDRRNYRKRLKNRLLREKKLAEGIPMRKARRLKEPESKKATSNETQSSTSSKELPKKRSLRKSKAKASKKTSSQPKRKIARQQKQRLPSSLLTLEAYQKAHSLHSTVCSSDLLKNPSFDSNFLEKTSPSVGHGTFEHPHWTFISSELHCICPSCGQTFEDVDSLSAHKSTSHPSLTFCCTTCAKPTRHLNTRNVHQTFHSSLAQLEVKYDQEVREFGPPPPNQNGRLYKCSKCPSLRFLFGWKYLLDHERISHPTTLFLCDICEKPLRQKNSLPWHRQTHFNAEEREQWWNEYIKGNPEGRRTLWLEKKMLRVHKKPVSKEKRKRKSKTGLQWNVPVQCSYCGKQFKTIYCLQSHEQRRHEGTLAKVPCPICQCPLEKYFLPSHVPTHFGEEERRKWEAWNGRWEEFVECVNNGKELPKNPKKKRYQGKKPKVMKPQGPKRPRGRPRKDLVWPPPENESETSVSQVLEGGGDSACNSSTMEFYQNPTFDNHEITTTIFQL